MFKISHWHHHRNCLGHTRQITELDQQADTSGWGLEILCCCVVSASFRTMSSDLTMGLTGLQSISKSIKNHVTDFVPDG